MTKIQLNHPLIYVTRDIERALGLPLATPGYFIISNSSPFAKHIAKKHKNVFLIDAGSPLDTHDLLERQATQDIIHGLPDAEILVFKNTTFIERVCEEKQLNLLNPPAQLANSIEEKITQLTLFPELRDLFLPYHVITGDELVPSDRPLVIQFNHSHTGNGTILAKNAKDLEPIRLQFPNRNMRVTEYVDGPIFTNNIVVTDTNILIGNINFQITGLKPFTGNKFATIGNDWKLPEKILNKIQYEQYISIATQVAKVLQARDWRGLFGIDVIMNSETKKLSLLEINARQPASTTFESTLQQRKRAHYPNSITTFEAHIAALRHENIDHLNLIPINDGAQIIIRERKKNISDKKADILAHAFEKLGHEVITYQSTAPESDRIRIRSWHGLMNEAISFNPNGQKIVKTIEYYL